MMVKLTSRAGKIDKATKEGPAWFDDFGGMAKLSNEGEKLLFGS